MRANDSSSAVEWSPAQFEELQLQVNISLHLDIKIVRFRIVMHLFFTIYKKKRSKRTRTILIVAMLNSHLQRNREEKSLRHVAMVAKFLDDRKPKIHLKSAFLCCVHLLHKAGA